jgi:ribosome biogenesis GTPase A
MNVTRKAILERIKEIDVVIELLDARLPGSSANPMLAELTGTRAKLKVLNKQDLADPERTEMWLQWYRAQSNTQAISLDASETAPAQRLIKACRDLVPNRGGMAKPVRVLICGIPNVGKSTLINSLMGKRSAKTGNEPGITKGEQRLQLADDVVLFDTPGMLWPKIIVEQGGYNLAASGAVGRNAMDEEEVALVLLSYLMRHYQDALVQRYGIQDVEAHWQDHDWLDAIGRRRGAMLGGGRVNIQKAAEIVLTDFRAGAIGRITLETPEEWQDWLAVAKTLEAERVAAREAAKAERQRQVKLKKA